MKIDNNLFILTTEYHFLLAVNIIEQQYDSPQFQNVLVFTGERLSMIKKENLPSGIRVLDMREEYNESFERFVRQKILAPTLTNIFVFTAYRDLETYVLCSAGPSIAKHLIQDGANFYFKITNSVTWSRLKETVKIYRNLWQKGVLLKKFVLYKKHLADCSFVDRVWVTNPEVYLAPRTDKPISKVSLFASNRAIETSLVYFGLKKNSIQDTLIYLSSKLSREDDIAQEIRQLKLILATSRKRDVLIKLHPNAPVLQQSLFISSFGDKVLKDFVPAELYLVQAADCCVVGVASAALFFENLRCRYYTVIKIFQHLGIYPKEVQVEFPEHVKVIGHVSEIPSA
jgi:hypothetical protein